MYSYEDRVRAVKLYIKLGKRMGATIRQLGYPTKNSLKAWHREYEEDLNLRMGYARAKSKYSFEERTLAVDHYLNHGQSSSFTRRALGYPSRATLAGWVMELCPQSEKRAVGKSAPIPYPEAFKQSAVVEFAGRQDSAKSIAVRLGVSRQSLYKWKDQLLGPQAPTSMKPSQDPQPLGDRSELERSVESLKQEVHLLQLERDLLKKAGELLKKDLGVDLQTLKNREKTQLVDALKSTYSLQELLALTGLARSSYFYHRAVLRGPDKYEHVRQTMVDLFEANQRCYGYRRLQAALGRQQICLSEKVVRRLMKLDGLSVLGSRRRRYSSYQGELSPAPENLIARDFRATAPNIKWLTDITEFQLPAGKVYLSPIIDCFDGLVVSWSLGTRPDARLVNEMLDAAIRTVANSDAKPIVHSDRGSHYRWPGWLLRMHEAKLPRSMSAKGCSPDNAACEGFFGRLKNEMFYARDWRNTTVEQFINVVDSYIRWYNEKRIKISLGALSPIEYRTSLGITT
jgi:transposase InsO family protein/transposase-like protein